MEFSESQNDGSEADLASSESEFQLINERVKESTKSNSNAGKKISFVWEYFETVSTGDSKVLHKCKICDTLVGNQTSNLGRHLVVAHNITRTNNFVFGKGRKTRSFVWKYSTKEDSHHARCHFCDKILYCGDGNTSNLSKHMRRKHSELIDESPQIVQEEERVEDDTASASIETIADDLEKETLDVRIIKNEEKVYQNESAETATKEEDSSTKKERKRGSYVWKYCTKINRDMVLCSLCDKKMSFHGTANLITHLQRRHNVMGMDGAANVTHADAHEHLNDNDIDDSNHYSSFNNDGRPKRGSHGTTSTVWHHFKRINRDCVVCLFCKKTLSYQGTSNLQRHLHRMHGVVTQVRTNKNSFDAKIPRRDGVIDIDEELIWKFCTKLNEKQVKCTMCGKILERTPSLDFIKSHLRQMHDLKPLRNESSSAKRSHHIGWDTLGSDESSSVGFADDFGNNNSVDNSFLEQQDGNGDNDLKKDESYFDDLIEEDHEMINEGEQDVNENENNLKAYEDIIDTIGIENPLSPKSSFDGSSGEQQRERPSNNNAHKIVEYTNKRLQRLHEERLRMETEYFREKAGFFRMRKYLTALHAKKVRIETESLRTFTSNNLNGPYTISVVNADDLPNEDLNIVAV